MTQERRQVLLKLKPELEELVKSAVADVGIHDPYLLETILKEETICHRFAKHIEDRMADKGWLNEYELSVDVEYNKYGLDKKTVPGYDAPDIPRRKKELRTFPDIIVHQRGRRTIRVTPDGVEQQPVRINLLAIEAKKTSNETPANKAYDLWKCKAYIESNLGYLFACYVRFNVGTQWTDSGKAASTFEFFTASP